MGRPFHVYACAAASVAVAIACFVGMQRALSEWMETKPIADECTQGEFTKEQRIDRYGLRPYEPMLGGSFVCIITQFMHALATDHPAGLLAWGSALLLCVPLYAISGIESGRMGARGPVRHPFFVFLAAQYLGAGVAVSGVWLPAYIFGGSRDGGAFHASRPVAAAISISPLVVLSVSVFVLDPNERMWSISAALLGGPLLAISHLIFYFFPAPTNATNLEKHEKTATSSLAKGYFLFGIMSYIGWLFLVYTSSMQYGRDIWRLVDAVWSEAHPAVQFMTIDALGLFLSALIFVSLRGASHVLAVLLLTPVVGPGASLCCVLIETENMYVIPDVQVEKKTK